MLEGALTGANADRVGRPEEAGDAVASLLNFAWTKDEPRVKGDAVAFAAFGELLRWLGDQQNLLGFELVGRIGGLL